MFALLNQRSLPPIAGHLTAKLGSSPTFSRAFRARETDWGYAAATRVDLPAGACRNQIVSTLAEGRTRNNLGDSITRWKFLKDFLDTLSEFVNIGKVSLELK